MRNSIILLALSLGLSAAAAVVQPVQVPTRIQPGRFSALTNLEGKLDGERQKASLLASDGEGVEKVLIDEDFSKFTAGVEGNPDGTDLCANEFELSSEWTHQPGWTGGGIYQAGGVAYLGASTVGGYEDSGVLISPTFEPGKITTVTVSFRARSAASSDYFFCMFCVYNPATDNFVVGKDESGSVTTAWKKFSYTFDVSSGQPFYFLFAGWVNPSYIDDIKITAFEPYMSAPEVSVYSDFKGDSFVANWQPVEGATSYLLTVYDQDNNYILQKKEVTETSYKVTGLDASKIYYYYVQAKGTEYTSGPSETMAVNSIAAPTPGETTVTESGFTANWSPVARANMYDFYLYKTHTAKADEKYSIAKSDFSWVTSTATVDDPEQEPKTAIELQEPSGWWLHSGCYTNGTIGIENWQALFGFNTYIESPSFDLSGVGGEITIDVDLYTPDDTYFLLYNAYGDGSFEMVDEVKIDKIAATEDPDWKHHSVTLKGGSKESLVLLMGSGRNDMLIDNLDVTVNLKKGQRFNVPAGVTVVYEGTSNTVSADMMSGQQYAWNVAGVYYDGETTVIGQYSDPVFVDSLNASVDELADESANAFVADGALRVENPDGLPVAVYSANGSLVSTSAAATIDLPSKGVYIVKIGSKVFKVVK